MTEDEASAADEEEPAPTGEDDEEASAADDEEASAADDEGAPTDDGGGATACDDTVPDLAARRGMETRVYGPAEDSRLLADAAVDAVDADDVVLDVGTGSGYVAARVAAEAGALVVASDVNPHACRAARARLLGDESTGADEDGGAGARDGEGTAGGAVADRADRDVVGVVRADLVAPFREEVFDVVLFNPPYLPTEPETGWDDWMERALSGGASGRAVVERFLPAVPRVLAPGGRVLLVASTLAGVDGVAEAAGEAGFSVAAVAEASFPFETMTVLELFR